MGPSVPQCVMEVVCPLAKNRLITAILAVPGKVDSHLAVDTSAFVWEGLFLKSQKSL